MWNLGDLSIFEFYLQVWKMTAGLEQTFLDFDNSGRGTITLEQLQETMQSRLNISSEEVTRVFHSFDFAQNEAG